MANFGSIRSEVYDRVSRSQYYRDNLAGLTAHQRHQKLLSELQRGDPALQQQAAADAAAAALSSTISDEDVLRQHHRFLRGPEEEAEAAAAAAGPDAAASWGARLARRYYNRLFKEYAIADLSRYKESKIGMRWRTKQEVISGKGQFTCGAKGCAVSAGLCSYEVNFAYVEAGQSKQALVKLRLCGDCGHKLNYKKEKQYKKLQQPLMQQQQEREPERRRRKQKHKRDREGAEGSDEGAAALRHGGSRSGSKRRRHSSDSDHADRRSPEDSSDDGSRGPRQQRQQEAGRRVWGDGNEALTDADIDHWLDSMFEAPAPA